MIFRYFKNKKIAKKVYELNNKALCDIQNIFKNRGLDTDITVIRSIDIFGEFLEQSMYISDKAIKLLNNTQTIYSRFINDLSKVEYFQNKEKVDKILKNKQLFITIE